MRLGERRSAARRGSQGALFDLDVQFKTHLDLLALGTERAAREGIFAARVRGDRVLLVTDIHGCNEQGWTDTEFARGASSGQHAGAHASAVASRPMSTRPAWT
jgi:hypothetical protein